jgi:hypothetical protein
MQAKGIEELHEDNNRVTKISILKAGKENTNQGTEN